jgi:hypothetical protein
VQVVIAAALVALNSFDARFVVLGIITMQVISRLLNHLLINTVLPALPVLVATEDLDGGGLAVDATRVANGAQRLALVALVGLEGSEKFIVRVLLRDIVDPHLNLLHSILYK